MFSIPFIISADPENLLVNNDYPMITGVQNDIIVIPCKPTSKNVPVQLIKDGDKVNINVRMLKYFFCLLPKTTSLTSNSIAS